MKRLVSDHAQKVTHLGEVVATVGAQISEQRRAETLAPRAAEHVARATLEQRAQRGLGWKLFEAVGHGAEEAEARGRRPEERMPQRVGGGQAPEGRRAE